MNMPTCLLSDIEEQYQNLNLYYQHFGVLFTIQNYRLKNDSLTDHQFKKKKECKYKNEVCSKCSGEAIKVGAYNLTSLLKIANPTFYRIIIDFEMQALQDLKEINDQRFDSIDKRWEQVEDVLRLEQKERQEDVHLLKERLQDRVCVADSLEKNKSKILKDNLDNLTKQANQCKENLEKCFDYQAQFSLNHLDKKNIFIQNYTVSGEQFVGRIDDYQKQKVRQITNRLEGVDLVNHEATNQTVRFVKQEKKAEVKAFFDQEKNRFIDQLSKARSDATKQIDQLRSSLRHYSRKRQQSDSKIQIMIASLGSQLSKLQEIQWKQGEITYDCLLKLVEDACAKIQEAQLR